MSYAEIMEGHDWETHLPASPEGLLRVELEHCPTCGGIARFTKYPDGSTLAVRVSTPRDEWDYCRSRVDAFMLRGIPMTGDSRLEPAPMGQISRELAALNPPDGITHSRLGPAGPWYQPLGVDLTPAFIEMLCRHTWRLMPERRGMPVIPGQQRWSCWVCRARMHSSTEGRVMTRAVVALPAGRRCQYLRIENQMIAVSGRDFLGYEPETASAAEIGRRKTRRREQNGHNRKTRTNQGKRDGCKPDNPGPTGEKSRPVAPGPVRPRA